MKTNLATDSINPADWLDTHGDYLFRYAMKHLRDTALAEDAVQDTLLGALQGLDQFSGESTLRTWLTGILKHKIIDVIRKQSREKNYFTDDPDASASTDWLDKTLFNKRGEWAVPQNHWGDPDKTLENERFWQAFAACLDGLPPKLARIFSLRELSGLQTEELCEILNITSSNCWVILYRARVALKECLESTWLTDRGGRGA